MAMSPTLLRPRRRAAVLPLPVEGSAPSAPTGISLTTAPLVPTGIALATAPSPPTGVTTETGLVAPTNVGLLAAPKNLTATEVFAPDAPTGLDLTAAPASPTGVQLSVVPSEPTSVTVTSAPSSPTGLGLLGAPANVAATESAATDPYFSDVSLLLQDSLTDESLLGQTITATGTAGTSTAQSKFGGVGFVTTGISNSLKAANDPAFAMPGDFTIESWIFFNTYSASESFSIWEPVNHGAGSFSSNRLQFLVFQGKLYTDVYGAVLAQSSLLGLVAGQWYHVAASRQGSALRLFLDGTQVASATTTRSFNADEYMLPQSGTGIREMYFDDFRLTVGTSRYNASFTPPTSAFPN